MRSILGDEGVEAEREQLRRVLDEMWISHLIMEYDLTDERIDDIEKILDELKGVISDALRTQTGYNDDSKRW